MLTNRFAASPMARARPHPVPPRAGTWPFPSETPACRPDREST
ncbi:thiopurine S-methyltransferase [Burkholderia thailandensis]|nr:thiopurine S-methyltransferase [Burkholderia thailandensis]AVR26422.1 thiopurine S-methyltransferase [Burkholderia thailandensis]AWY59731.1 thiopurine S-methyltransferase [Burkholderia thailandensis]AWY69160.1 thiopurine S-methyltransferase [Burkholderia thailandensis]MDD1479834.1 thiopurine S-methyltransferase [Burkholderia thailandensis]